MKISPKGLRQLRRGHLWVYASDVRGRPGREAGVVELCDPGGRLLGFALFSPRSRIALRLLHWGEGVPTLDLLRERLQGAAARRQQILSGCDAYRLIHGEADLLPGLFVDRYGDCFVVQSTCAAAEKLEGCVVDLLSQLFAPRAVVLRNDTLTRNREGLDRHVRLAVGQEPVFATYHEGAVRYCVDLLAGQKTGAYLDQRENHLAAGQYARGRALDCFCYQGGFALQLAQVCEEVLLCDQSEAALKAAQLNAERAGVGNVSFAHANAFDFLAKLEDEEERFDTIVLDPPAFASSKETLDRARRAYKSINARAMRLLNRNGILVSCSCSGRMRADAFEQMLAAAACQAGRAVQLLERRSAGPDHPVLATMPETDYLKCRIMVVL